MQVQPQSTQGQMQQQQPMQQQVPFGYVQQQQQVQLQQQQPQQGLGMQQQPQQQMPQQQGGGGGGLGSPAYSQQQQPQGHWGAPPAPQHGQVPPPSATPQRQESWGMPPAQAAWVAIPRPPYADTPFSKAQENYEDRKSEGFTRREIQSLVWSWIFTIIMWFLLFVVLPICETVKNNDGLCSGYWNEQGGRSGTFPVFLGLVYAFLLGVCLGASPVRGYVGQILPEGVAPYLEKLKSATPRIRTEIVCDTTGAHGVRIHQAQCDWTYDAWWDVSQPMANTGPSGATRLRISTEWKAADSHTAQVHGKHQAAFVRANERKTHEGQAVTNHVTLQAVIPDLGPDVVYFPNPKDAPNCLGTVWCVVFSVLTFGVLYQHYFYARVSTVNHWVCAKLIRRDRRPDDPQ